MNLVQLAFVIKKGHSFGQPLNSSQKKLFSEEVTYR